ncbi:MAG: Lrp/AsnC family transcriptional regulator, partial [Synergistaceae bacterium]|nr:Lrp/AsnC family transcriptional regulator [Synergistaceae bacterium]
MKEIAYFVSSRLAIIDEVQSTATHIVLVRYKDHGTSFVEPHKDLRMVVTP